MSRILALAAVLAVSFGCATKKHVRMQVDPLQQRVGQMEARAKQTDAAIGDLQRGVSLADEHALAADAKAREAGQLAAKANEAAARVGQQAEAAQASADKAQTAAERGLSRTAELDRKITGLVTGLEDYKLTATETVLFDFGKSKLTEESKAKLDDTAARLRDHRRYVIEVQGFTDKIGGQEYNLELSRKRAAEVVRYLTVAHKVPLYRIHILGLGSVLPVADDKTSEGRKQNRRVEVKVYSADHATGKLTSSLQ